MEKGKRKRKCSIKLSQYGALNFLFEMAEVIKERDGSWFSAKLFTLSLSLCLCICLNSLSLSSQLFASLSSPLLYIPHHLLFYFPFLLLPSYQQFTSLPLQSKNNFKPIMHIIYTNMYMHPTRSTRTKNKVLDRILL